MRAPNKSTPPQAYVDYVLCKEFGWTPDQLDQQDDYEIQKMLTVMSVIGEQKKKEHDKKEAMRKIERLNKSVNKR